MVPYQAAYTALAAHICDAHRIDRVLLDGEGGLYFSINGTTYVHWRDGVLSRHYALDDPELPLARWASAQPARRFNLLAYRPGKRIVIHDLQRNVVLKGFRQGKSEAAATKHRIAANALASSVLNVPKLHGHDAQRACIVMAYNGGRQLQLGRLSKAMCCSLGQHISLLSSANIPDHPAELAVHGPTEELQLVDSFGRKMCTMLGELPPLWLALVQCAQHDAPALSQQRLCHRDLHDGQWQRAARELTLIDYDLLCLADPMLDLGNMLAHVQLRQLQQPGTGGDSVAEQAMQILHGYASCSPLNEANLHWYTATSLLRLAMVYSCRPRWRHLVAPLTDASAQCLQLRNQCQRSTT